MCTKVSVGALVPAKIWYRLVDFERKDDEWSYKENPVETQVSIDDLNCHETQVQILELNGTKNILGVFLAMGGINVAQISHNRKVVDERYKKVMVGQH